jgi:hypothetical protein
MPLAGPPRTPFADLLNTATRADSHTERRHLARLSLSVEHDR